MYGEKASSVLRLNFARLFKSRLALVALVMSNVLALAQPFFMHGPVYESGWNNPASVFCKWIGGEFYSFPGQLLFTLLPIIAMLPFGVQLHIDSKNGYLKNLLTRKPKWQVILSYYITTFCSAFTVCVFPFFLNLFVNAALYPSLLPQASSGSYRPLFSGVGVALFYRHPYIYSCLYILFIGVFMALLACVGLAVATFIKNAFLALLFPFISYFGFSLFTSIISCNILNPLYFIQPTQTQNTPAIVYALFLVLMCTIFAPIAACQVIKHEIL